MKITVAAKPTSENFILNYTKYLPDFCDCSLYVPPAWPANQKDAINHIHLLASNSDVLVLEWANDFTALVLNRKLPCKVIVRVHDHEVRKGRVDSINWNYVDAAWFINQDVQKTFHVRYPNVQSFFLPNAIDPKPFTEHQSTEKKIGLLSLSARTRKRFDRAFELMELLKNDGWELHIRTDADNPDYVLGMAHTNGNYTYSMLREMSKNLPVKWTTRGVSLVDYHNGHWYGNKRVDVNEFFRDKAVVLSTSDHEGFHYAIGQGALCGAMPVVWNWNYGRARDFWEPFTYGSIADMASAIRNYEPSGRYRKYVLDNYHPRVLIPQLLKEIKQV